MLKNLNKIPPKQKTSYTSKILRKFGLFVLKNYKFKGYNSIILFKVKKGKYKSYILKKTWNQFLKYKKINLKSLVDPKKYIFDLAKKRKVKIDKNFNYTSLRSNKRTSDRVIFTPKYGKFKDIQIDQSLEHFLKGYGFNPGNFYKPEQAIKLLFFKRKRIVLDSFKISKNTRISSLKVPNYPLSGKFQGFLFISNYSKVVDRNDGFEFKNLYEKKKFIQSLIPNYKILSSIDSNTKSEEIVNTLCDENHTWSTKITNIIHGSKCLHCAAENKNQIGGESFDTYKNNPEIANYFSNTYIVLIKGKNKKHLKIGIANNILKRGSGKYIKIYYKFRSKRANCWCLEMYLKKLTYKYRSGHNDKDVNGWTEFRDYKKINRQKLILIAKKTTKIIIKYGWRKFYKKYLTRGKKLDHTYNEII